MDNFLQRFATDFASLNASNLHRLSNLYSDDVEFRDPLHRISGLSAVEAYFANLYSNVEDLSFVFEQIDQLPMGNAGYLRWTMRFRHPRLRRGQPIEVSGCSHLRWTDKVYLHHDYFDAGALLYEHVPVMGGLTRWLKRRLA
jgi:ketosteroid isomerase-like protein